MKEKIIYRPFSAWSLIYVFAAIIFPSAAVTLAVLMLVDSIDKAAAVGGIAACLVLSAFVGRYVHFKAFADRIEIEDSGITIIRFPNGKMFAKPKAVKEHIWFSDITQYGDFYSYSLRNGGRDELNRRIVIYEDKDSETNYIVPEMTKNYGKVILINGRTAYVMIDSRLFNDGQVRRLFNEIEEKTGIAAQGRELRTAETYYPTISIIIFCALAALVIGAWELLKLIPDVANAARVIDVFEPASVAVPVSLSGLITTLIAKKYFYMPKKNSRPIIILMTAILVFFAAVLTFSIVKAKTDGIL